MEITNINIILCVHIICRLLDILAGRKDKSGLTGQVLVNGQPQPNNFKCISGYVVQVSNHHGENYNYIQSAQVLINLNAVKPCHK